MHSLWILLTLLNSVTGSSLEDENLAPGTPLRMLWRENHFNNSGPLLPDESRNLSARQLNFQLPKIHGRVWGKNQSTSSKSRKFHMRPGPKHASRQIRINYPYSIRDHHKYRKRMNKNPSNLAEVSGRTRESSIQSLRNNFDIPNAQITSKPYSKAQEGPVDTWAGNNSSSLDEGMVEVTDNACVTKHTLDSCLARATSSTPAVRGLPHTPAQLQRMCQLFKGGMRCVDSYTTRCLSPEKRALLEDNIVGTRSFLAVLCDDPSFQRDYLSHALCMKAVSAHWDDCYLHFQYLLRLELRATADSDFEDMCCLRQKFLVCVDKAADIACNLDDALFLRKVTATLSYAEHRTLMCQREYSCFKSLAARELIAGQLGLATLLFVFTWSQNALG